MLHLLLNGWAFIQLGSFTEDIYGAARFLVVFLLSLMGIPPLVGFMGKLYVFAALIEKGPALWWLAVAGALNAALAAWYYARVLRVMMIDKGDERPAWSLPAIDQAWLILFLVSDASRFCTGQIWRANGGQALAR